MNPMGSTQTAASVPPFSPVAWRLFVVRPKIFSGPRLARIYLIRLYYTASLNQALLRLFEVPIRLIIL